MPRTAPPPPSRPRPHRAVAAAVRSAVIAGGLAVVLFASGCASALTPGAASPSSVPGDGSDSTGSAPLPAEGSIGAPSLGDTGAAAGTAVATLASLPVKGRAPKTGYDRVGSFGTAWLDVDHNGCDTRNDILARDLTAITLAGPCKVMAGTLLSPYTAERVDFVRGNDTSMLVQIDHLVALSNAWQTGAQQLSQARREALANDPLNLLAVDGGSNSQKGDGDAATWLPANTAIRCGYVARQIAVKASYALWVTPAEHDAMARILTGCPDQPLPTDPDTPGDAGSPAPDGVAVPPVVYANCAAVRAAGAAPLYSGQPGYSAALDRDGDGVGCDS